MGERFYQKGIVREDESGTEVMFHIDNLGPAGTGGTEGAKDFKIYHNNAIDSFGKKYWTRNGGRRQTYVAFDGTGIGQQQDNLWLTTTILSMLLLEATWSYISRKS